MGGKLVRIVWYGFLLGVSVLIFDKVFGGLIGGLKTGLGRTLGV